jgi:hypothetical protein
MQKEEKKVPIRFFSVSVIHPENNRSNFLIIHEPLTSFGDVWYFPGGKVDKGKPTNLKYIHMSRRNVCGRRLQRNTGRSRDPDQIKRNITVKQRSAVCV